VRENLARSAGGEAGRGPFDHGLSSSEWRGAFDAIAFPVLILGPRGRVRHMNRAALELAGRRRSPSPGLPVETLGHQEPWRQAAELAARARSTRASGSARACDQDSRRSWELVARWIEPPTALPAAGALAASRASRSAQGLVVVTVRETSELVKLQESLRRSEVMSQLGVLVGGVAHEIRNPLFGLSAAVDACADAFGERAELGDYLAIFRSQVERINDLVSQLFELGKPRGAALVPGDLHGAVEEAIVCCGSLARQARVAIERRLALLLPEVAMDRARLVVVFRNLIANAVEHSPPGTAVVVGAAACAMGTRAGVRCTVEDRGPGLPQEDLPRLFEPFFSRRHGGTGLGLAVALSIAEEHGGAIEAANREMGGACFSLYLPCANAPARRAAGATPGEDGP
jgi:signal transduction histidine kinase